MELQGAVTVITGGASGIGRAMAQRFKAEGAVVAIVDLDPRHTNAVAEEIGVAGYGADVTDESAMVGVIESVEKTLGPIDLWCGNAGIGAVGGVELPDDVWQSTWEVNLMAHVIAARHLVPRFIERGHGYFLITASAAGLLTNLGTAPYAVTKHAAVALAEWLAITHADDGIKVSCLCPQGVRTPMTDAPDGELALDVVKSLGLIEPEEVAEVVVEALRQETFLVLPHPEVSKFEQARSGDRDRWLRGLSKLQRTLRG